MEQSDAMREESTLLSQGLAFVAAALTGAVATWAIERFLHAHIGHDQAWELYASAEVLRGIPMNGRDLVEVNPPFLLWFMSLPVLLARVLHLRPVAGFQAFFLAMALPATLWSASLFRRLVRPRPLVFWVFLLLIAWAGGMNMMVEDVGQREHMVAFLLLPYLLLAAMRIEGKPVSLAEGIGIGLAAAIAICLKPQHLLDVSAAEAVVLWRVRNFRVWLHPAWIAFSIALIGYFSAVRLLQPTYFTDVVPLLRSTYWGFNSSLHDVLYKQRRAIRGLIGGAILLLGLRTRLRMASLETVLLAAGTGALVAYLQQHKAWTYQMICVEFLTVLLIGLILTDLLDRVLVELPAWPRLQVRSFYAGAALLAGALAGLALARHQPRPEPFFEPEKEELAEIYSAYPAGTSVGFLSVFPWQFPAVLEQDKVWAFRYYHLWLLPAILRSENPADTDSKNHLSASEIDRLSTLLRSTITADLERRAPRVVVTQTCSLQAICDSLQGQHLATILDWFLLDPAFRAEWSHYRLQQTIKDLDVYTRVR